MKTFFTSDTHFFHENIIRFCNRPYGSVEHMNDSLVANWNMVVQPRDEVFFLGDFSFGNDEQTAGILRRLNGLKHLVTGNHDRKGRCEKLFNQQWHHFFHTKQDYQRIKINKQGFVLCHFPFHSWERGYINLHGHTHGTYASKYMQHDVGVDVNNYTPLLLDDAVKRAMDEKKPKELY